MRPNILMQALSVFELVYKETQCLLCIKDNGQGFTIDNATSNSSFGILGMRERSINIGAELTFNSKLEQGAEILVSLNCINLIQ